MVKKSPLLSIIIPVYNCEKYIERLVKSVNAQTFKDYEVLLIDDGSKDNSLKVLKELEKKYSYVKVFTEKNSGPSSARNLGMENSVGKYMLFLDADDYLDENYIETLYNEIKDSDYDIVMSGFRKVDSDGKKFSYIRKLNDGEFAKYIVTATWGKIYRTEFLRKNNIKYVLINHCEDLLFNIDCFNAKAKVKTLDYIGYNYFYNTNSYSNTLHVGFKEHIQTIDFLNLANVKNIENIELNEYFILRYIVTYMLYSGKGAKVDAFMKEYKKFSDWLKENIPSYRKNKYLRRKPKGELSNVHAVVRIFFILEKLNLLKLFAKGYLRKNK